MSAELTAILRQPSEQLDRCELVHLDREAIDHQLARKQHATYRDHLKALEIHVLELPALPEHPDAIFVEDCALVLDEVAVLTRPGAPSRRDEVTSLAPILAEYREVLRMHEPATIDGGDLLVHGKTVLLGMSQRSNEAGAVQLRAMIETFGYQVKGVPVEYCLHLKSAISSLGDGRVLANPNWIEADCLPETEFIHVHTEEPYGANVLSLPESLVCSSSYPRTNQILRDRGFAVQELDFSELHKMEAAMTCPSLIFRSRSDPR